MIARKRVSLLACLMLAGMPQIPSSAFAAGLDSAYAFDIPAQDLSSALVLFAKQTEIQVITASRDLGTYRIEAVQGQFSARDILTKLLAGTGLSFVEVGDGTVTISKSAEQSARRGADDASLQNTNDSGILQEVTVFGRGTTETVKDVPQTVSVFNADFIRNVQATMAEDIVRFTPNAVPYGWAVPLNTTVVIRGFASSLTWNGMAQRSTNGTLKLANVERVEVLKGPASVLYGSMEPGAVINLVTKRPQQQFEASGNLQFGSNNERHYELDIGGPLTDRIGARLNVANFETDTPFNNTGTEDLFIAPVVEFKLADRTTLIVDGFYDKADWPNGFTDGRVPVRGGLLPNPYGQIPLRTNLQYDRDITAPAGFGDLRHPQEDIDLNARLSHDFNDDVTLNFAMSYHNSKYDREHIFTGGLAADNRTMSRSYLIDKGYDSTAYIAHADLKWGFATGSLTHEAVLGIDYTDTQYSLLTAFLGITPIDIYAPVYGTIVLPDPIPFDDQRGDSNVAEAFLQDRISLGNFHLLAGGRFSDYESEDDYTPYEGELAVTGIKDQIWSTQFGALYDVNDWLTLFASRNESFVPRLAQIFGRGLIAQPERGLQYELGAKFVLGNSGLTGSVVLFDIDKKDVLVSDEAHVGYVVPLGGVNSKGVEVSVEGSPYPGLSIYFGYGYNPTEIEEADANTGNSFFNVPEHTFSTYLNYKVQDGALRDLSLTTSVQYVGKRWASDANTIEWPAYTRVDVGANYPVGEHLLLGVNVRNLFESKIYTGFGASRVARDPFRTILGTVAYRY
ncbi:TonB-dependent siderophore receptor [Steroidobacter sp.]|uniref:TonB-dependent siderophore receptor n=1 Tax=Steroidobacter sp. TaxID=1978227 RepID=UPI001A42792A|nr:TonB-dependent receptor [Steroidobacter sp.]MBL8272092.1 TonB-dependent receptor [Steroidobacter sp.]